MLVTQGSWDTSHQPEALLFCLFFDELLLFCLLE